VKLPELQELLSETKLQSITEKTPLMHRRCPTCKKGTLETVLLFNERGPPKNWNQLLKTTKPTI